MNKKKNDGKRSYILTKETLGMTILLFSFVVLVMLLTNKFIFMGFGAAICTFMYGTFGYGSYLIVAALAYLGEWLVFERKLKFNWRCTLLVVATALMLFMLFHAVTTAKYDMGTYGGYLAQCYNNAALGYAGYSFGGVICGLLVYPIAKGTTFVGAYVIFSLLAAACGVLSFFVIRNVVLGKVVARTHKQKAKTDENSAEETVQTAEVTAENVDNLYSVNENHEIVTKVGRAPLPRQQEVSAQAKAEESKPKAHEQKNSDDRFSPENLGRRILFENGEFAAESYRRNMIYNEDSYFNHPVQSDADYLRSFSSGSPAQASATPSEDTSYTEDYSSQIEELGGATEPPAYLYGDKPAENLSPEQSAYNTHEEEYSSYTVDESSAIEYDEQDGVSEEIEEPQPQIPVQEENPAGNSPYDLNFDDEIKPAPQADDIRVDESPVIARRQEFEESAENSEPEEQPKSRSSLFDLFSPSNPRLSEQRRVEPDVSALQSSRREISRENLFDEDGESDGGLFGDRQSLAGRGSEEEVEKPERAERVSPVSPVNALERVERVIPAPKPTERKQEVPQPAAAEEEKPKHVWKKYVRPTLDLLKDYPENNNVNTAEIEESKQIICETLADYRIESRISNVVVGPAITRYDVIIEDRTNIKNALKYREAIAMALMKENVNAYLNYSKGAISIEVPNSSRTVVGLKSMLASSQFLNAKPNSLTFALGKNVEGTVVCPDITKMPHLLVAGTTGSGKSICLSTLIVSLLYKYGPEELRFILVDPKQVEFISYDKLPHLMINEIIYDVDKAIKALNWAIKEMERRYQLFKEMTEKGVATKNLTEYNQHLPDGEEKLPKIVIILDEFGDLMLQAKKDIETRIIRLVQKARACGIHLILATQRPSVDCITGLIKSNLPTRIGFKVNSFDDARCIFDIGGAEKLLGKGDLYFRSAENPDLARIQGCFIDTPEVQRVTDFIKQNNETYFDQSVSDFINTVEEEPAETVSDGGSDADASKVDDTFIKALKFCVTSNQASVSMIQRRFPIGYMKACKIIDWMENMNYITQSEGSKPRKVLLSREEFVQRYGDVDD